jgi:uncharacterized damage-inducible protein DinB
MQISLLRNIFHILTYNKWANERLLSNVNLLTDEYYYKTLSIPFNNIHGLLYHILYHEYKFQNKLLAGEHHPNIAATVSRSVLEELILYSSTKWIDWVEKIISTKRIPDTFDEIFKSITDLSIHNNYHRGQINVTLSLLGFQPQTLDIFVFNKENAATI